MPLKLSKVETNNNKKVEGSIEVFKKALLKDISAIDFEMYLMHPNIKEFCAKIIAKQYGKEGADKMLKTKSSTVIISMLRDCFHTSALYTKARENATISKAPTRSTSIHLSQINSKSNIKKTSKGKGSTKLLNLTCMADPQEQVGFPFYSIIQQRPSTTNVNPGYHSANNSFVKIPPRKKYPTTLQEMNAVIKLAEEYTGEKPMSASPYKRARWRNHNQIAKMECNTPILKSIPSYSKYPKEMDYKTFAMIYRIKQRDRVAHISCMSLYT